MGKFNTVLKKAGKTDALPNIFTGPKGVHKNQILPDETYAERPRPAGPEENELDFNALDINLVAYHDPASAESEIFRVLRSNILFPKTGRVPRSIMVTSPSSGDGKSFVAGNLAISIAQGVEEHVLLMDCDMRRSSIHRNFGLGDDVSGLSEYLSKGSPLQDLLRKTAVDKLTILPGGKIPTNPAELLSSQVMRNLIEEVTERYKDRFIIIDSPPPQLTAETNALAQYVDGILIVVRAGKTPRDQIEELVETFGREKLLGVVLNGYQKPVSERLGAARYKAYTYSDKKA